MRLARIELGRCDRRFRPTSRRSRPRPSSSLGTSTRQIHLAPDVRRRRSAPPGSGTRQPSRAGVSVAERPMRCGFGAAAGRRPDRSSRAKRQRQMRAALARRPSREFRRRRSSRRCANSARDFSAVRKMKSDSGVVTSTCGGLRSISGAFARRACRRFARRCESRQSAIPRSPRGAHAVRRAEVSRFLRTSLVSALSGET